ncbi:MAG: hypothetical protein JW809_12440 [Pirellulales bacterium]|nr:hypothetical protein [Pirellulales bacterium]
MKIAISCALLTFGLVMASPARGQDVRPAPLPADAAVRPACDEAPLPSVRGRAGPCASACQGRCGCGGSCCFWCPDDYCPKPAPCVCLPRTCGRCDDYCPKPAPCVCPPRICGGCDDYCPKPAPCVQLCPWPNSFYRCVPMNPPRRCAPAAAVPAASSPGGGENAQ